MALGAIVSATGGADADFPQPDLVVVDEGGLRPSTFSLRYGLQLTDGDFQLLVDDRLGPDSPVAVQVAPGGSLQTLLRGTVLQQDLDGTVGGDGSTLLISGADKTAAMGWAHKNRVWCEVSDAMAVEQILSQHGLIPRVESTSTTHTEAKHSLVQRESDLEFIHRLARRNGCWFWLEYDPSGQTVQARFARPPMSGQAAVTLSVRAGSANVDRIGLSWDIDRPTGVSAKQLDLNQLAANDGSLDRSPLSGLARQALADIVKTPRTRQLAVPVSDQAELQARAEALLIEAGWFVTARVTASLSRLKSVVRANTLVELDGLGSRHSGKYLVARVVHRIDAVDHTMTIDIVRNGWN